MKENIKIRLENVNVVGIDTSKRVASIRQALFAKNTLSSVKIPILNNINFIANSGDIIGIIGKNGCGKSSLLKTIAGIYPIESGIREVKGKIAPIIEMGIGFDHELTGRANIKLSLCYSNRFSDYSKELEQQIIEFAELEDHIDSVIKHYSSGMIARLAFAISVLQHPDILILDEVLATGDNDFIKKSYNYMTKKLDDVAIAIIVNHSIEQIKALCNKCVYMKKGHIVATGISDQIIKMYEEDDAASIID